MPEDLGQRAEGSSEGSQVWRWLTSTVDLQRDTYGYPIGQDWSPAELAQYLQWNTFAIYNELAELAYEYSWKPWATDPPFVNRSRILGEAIDILHFLGNILVGINVTDQELWQHYQLKQALNRARAQSGNYSAQKGGVGEGSDG